MLRWVLVVITAILVVGYFLLALVGNSFRRSFGASELGALVVGVPLLVGGLILATLFCPTQKLLLHATALVVLPLVASCLWLMKESVFTGGCGLAYFGAWLVFYWLCLSSPSTARTLNEPKATPPASQAKGGGNAGEPPRGTFAP